MPPQLTDITSETERDAATLGLGPTIALARDAMDEALAAASLSASIAALDDTGPTTAPARGVLSLLGRYWRAFQAWRQRQGLRTALHDLSDRELTDIGLTRAEIDYIAGRRAIDTLRDDTRYLWDRGGM